VIARSRVIGGLCSGRSSGSSEDRHQFIGFGQEITQFVCSHDAARGKEFQPANSFISFFENYSNFRDEFSF
jgi:hypothetical protein